MADSDRCNLLPPLPSLVPRVRMDSTEPTVFKDAEDPVLSMSTALCSTRPPALARALSRKRAGAAREPADYDY